MSAASKSQVNSAVDALSVTTYKTQEGKGEEGEEKGGKKK